MINGNKKGIKKIITGIIIFALVALFVIIVPLFGNIKSTDYFLTEDGTSRLVYGSPSAEHFFGTDAHGRDIFFRLAWGGRATILFTFSVVAAEFIIGCLIGAWAGFSGGIADRILMRIADIFNCIPFLPLLMVTAGILDKLSPSDFQRVVILCFIYGIFGWTGFARLIRGEILNVKSKEFVSAAKASGISGCRIVFRHILPVIFPQLAALIPFNFASVMLTESALGFLGLGIRYPSPSWGNMLDGMRNLFVIQNYPFAYLPAAALIFSTACAFWLIGEGAKDKLNG